MEQWTLIFIIFIIIILIFNYFNIYRYLRIHFDNDSDYIKNYKNLRKCIDCRIVISLTTTPDRIKFIKPVIKSLLDQTVKVDQICLNIPKSCKGVEYDIPDDLHKMCNIFTCGRDYGPGSKFIPTILRENDANTIIIMLDDDFIYGKDFIKILLSQHNLHPDKAIFNNEFLLIKPEFLDKNVLYTNKKYIDNDWIKKYINADKLHLKYNYNLRSFII